MRHYAKTRPPKSATAQNVTPKKAIFSPHKIENGRISFLSTQKKSLPESLYQKKSTRKLLTQKKSQAANFKPQKGLRTSPSLIPLSTPPGVQTHSAILLVILLQHFHCNCLWPSSLKYNAILLLQHYTQLIAEVDTCWNHDCWHYCAPCVLNFTVTIKVQFDSHVAYNIYMYCTCIFPCMWTQQICSLLSPHSHNPLSMYIVYM